MAFLVKSFGSFRLSRIRRFGFGVTFALATGLVGLGNSPAAAQEAAPTPTPAPPAGTEGPAPTAAESAAPAVRTPGLTEEIVVTARKREETAATVPVALAAVAGEDLERQNLVTIADTSQLVPGLNVNSDATSRAFVSIRGIGTALFNSVQPGVGIFRDGVNLPSTAYANLPMLDADRVEVLKGPQGTLYGKNTLGGAINVITRKPSDTFEGQVNGEGYSGDDSYAGNFRLSGPLVPGKLRGRIAGGIRHSDGFFENTLIGGPIDNHRSDTVNGSLVWQASDAVELTGSGYYLDLKGPATAYGTVTDNHDFRDDIYKLNVSSNDDGKYTGGNLRLGWNLGNSIVTGIFAYDQQKLDTHQDADFSPIDIARVHAISDRDQRTLEVRVDTNWSNTFSTLFGVFASNDDQDLDSRQTVVPLGLTIPTINHQTADSKAIFGTAFWHLAGDMEFTLGLRYDDNDAKLEAITDPAHSPRRISSTHFEPRVSLSKFWSPESMTYVSVARGDREGGFNGTNVPQELWVIKPDRVWTGEIGQKMTLGAGKTSLDGDVFYTDYKDFIGQNALFLSNGGLVAAVLNVGDATSYGAELQATHQINEHWSVAGSGAYIHMRATNQDGWAAIFGAPLATDRLIFQPDWTFNLRTDYGTAVGQGWLGFGTGLYGKGDAVGATLKTAPNAVPIIPSYYLLDSYVSYAIGKVQLRLLGTNLTNEEYWQSYIDDSVNLITRKPLGIQGPKRRFGLQVGYTF